MVEAPFIDSWIELRIGDFVSRISFDVSMIEGIVFYSKSIHKSATKGINISM